jgi:hypothetical protein
VFLAYSIFLMSHPWGYSMTQQESDRYKIMEDSRIIEVSNNDFSEMWLVIYSNGRIGFYEKVGPRKSRSRSRVQTISETIDMAAVARMERQYAKPLMDQVQAALAEMARK